MKDVARLIRSHFDGIVAWARTRQTNGFLEASTSIKNASPKPGACAPNQRTA